MRIEITNSFEIPSEITLPISTLFQMTPKSQEVLPIEFPFLLLHLLVDNSKST